MCGVGGFVMDGVGRFVMGGVGNRRLARCACVNKEHGGLGGSAAIHEHKALNHHFAVYLLRQPPADGQIPSSSSDCSSNALCA